MVPQLSVIGLFAISLGAVDGTQLAQWTTPNNYGESAVATAAGERTLADLGLSETSTREDAVRLFGHLQRYGPAGAVEVALLPSGELLWLSFTTSEPRSLTRAVLMVGYPQQAHILFDRIARTQTRKAEALDFGRTLTDADVDAAWGPPDSVVGSGIETWLYELADGGTAMLWFSAGKVKGHRFVK
jgi:hypothetical protein